MKVLYDANTVDGESSIHHNDIDMIKDLYKNFYQARGKIVELFSKVCECGITVCGTGHNYGKEEARIEKVLKRILQIKRNIFMKHILIV